MTTTELNLTISGDVKRLHFVPTDIIWVRLKSDAQSEKHFNEIVDSLADFFYKAGVPKGHVIVTDKNFEITVIDKVSVA
jgi:hypothetical protein